MQMSQGTCIQKLLNNEAKMECGMNSIMHKALQERNPHRRKKRRNMDGWNAEGQEGTRSKGEGRM
eukprot:6173817-Pleurochrysis_carterae.AAC.2